MTLPSADPSQHGHLSDHALSAHVDGEVAPDGSIDVAVHLRTCGRCQARLDQLASVRAAVAATVAAEIPAPAHAPGGATARAVAAALASAGGGQDRGEGPLTEALGAGTSRAGGVERAGAEDRERGERSERRERDEPGERDERGVVPLTRARGRPPGRVVAALAAVAACAAVLGLVLPSAFAGSPATGSSHAALGASRLPAERSLPTPTLVAKAQLGSLASPASLQATTRQATAGPSDQTHAPAAGAAGGASSSGAATPARAGSDQATASAANGPEAASTPAFAPASTPAHASTPAYAAAPVAPATNTVPGGCVRAAERAGDGTGTWAATAEYRGEEAYVVVVQPSRGPAVAVAVARAGCGVLASVRL